MRITKRAIEFIEKPTGGYSIHRDDEMPGFAVRVTSRGVISFLFEKRVNGRSRRFTVGRYPAITPEQARRRVQRLSLDVAEGRDPITEHKLRRVQGITLSKALDDYLHDRDLRDSSRKDIRTRIKCELSDWLALPIKRITRDMVVTRHRRIGERSPSQANATMRYLRAVLNYASEAYGTGNAPFLADIPTRRLSGLKAWYRVERRRTLIKVHELPDWWKAVEGLATDPAMRHGSEYRDYFQWLLLTGMRRNEALTLPWAGVDLKARTVTLQDTKNREPHTLPLTDYLLTILERRRADGEGQFVFAADDGRVIGNLRYALAAIAKARGASFTPHDLRRTFATAAEGLDLPSYTIKRLLNHKQASDVTSGYLVIDTERLRAPMQKITDYILRAAGVIENNVVRLAPVAAENAAP
jgi:integrase